MKGRQWVVVMLEVQTDSERRINNDNVRNLVQKYEKTRKLKWWWIIWIRGTK